ncbi:MAG: hypothetical protein IT351_05285 [Candidatus Fermentibacter sp.]|nr:hypothetical protein [Candidatus Fermentibacter sp.]
MRTRSGIKLFLLAAASLMAVSCGDDEQGPSGSGTNPTASTLEANASATVNSVTARWTGCPDADFEEYRLYRSTQPGIAGDQTGAVIVATHTSASDTVFTDTGLSWSETYYYALRTRDTEGLVSWSNEATAVTPDSGATGGWLTCADVQGGAASSPYEGQVVTVTGVVTVGGGEFYTSSGAYAVLSDPEGGPWSGLVLYGDSVGRLVRGDSIAITGTVQEHFGMTELGYPTSILMLGTGAALPAPAAISTNNLTDAGGAEQWEGVLVEITDAVITSLGTYGQFEVNDGSGACLVDDLGSYIYNPAVGDTLYRAAGIGWYSFDEWKLEPRDDDDLEVSSGGGPGEVLSCYQVQGQAAQSPYVGQIVSVTGIVTVAGGEYYSSSQGYSVIEDAGGGPWSGLVLFDSDVLSFARGDSVVVTGTVQEYYGMTELSYITDARIISSGHPLPAPQDLTTGALMTSADPEEWEGVLVRVQNVTVSNDSLGYGQWSVTDGSGDCIVDDLGDYTYEPYTGDSIQSIIGVCFYSFSEFKMEPRDDADIDI